MTNLNDKSECTERERGRRREREREREGEGEGEGEESQCASVKRHIYGRQLEEYLPQPMSLQTRHEKDCLQWC